MRAHRGRLILPNRELKRFRLPDVPTEVAATLSPPAPGRSRALLAAAWLVFCTLCFLAAEGITNPVAAATERLPQWWERMTAPPPVPSAAPAARAPTSEPAPKPKPARRVRLPPRQRHRPETHGSGQFQSGSDLAAGLPPMPQGSPLGASALRLESPDDGPEDVAAVRAASAPPRAVGEPARASQVGRIQPQVAPPFSVAALDANDPLGAAFAESFARSEPGSSTAQPRPNGARPVPDVAEPESEVEPSQRSWTATRGQGCEEAYAAFEQTIDVEAAQAPDVPRGSYARLLEDFSNYRGCDLDHEMDVSICIAVVNGRARGVTIKTQPANARLAVCIASAVARLKYPASPRMDLVRTELIVR